MKIVENKCKIDFEDLKYGEVFKCEESVYMKVMAIKKDDLNIDKSNSYNCVDLSDGILKYCFPESEVQLVNNPVLTLNY
ncbi:hypothetical protein [uncultured Eubacterium sp.]|uniref:hypothetical protein n=1 Tax=uncultured Eubacterium sp. TaxID=165185 RepID=UPI0025997988|nr:hypothetical protein [uncultured Eubacterium sp.]